jgi:hypothetical protein|tara:strand:- start:166 stop:840 length:675 start_codon:yes stop_codon:yes gene_type:complete
MANFQTRIEDIIGATASLGTDNAAANEQAIQDALQDTVNEIFNTIRPEILIQYATKSSNITSNPVASSLENSRILIVERRQYKGDYVVDDDNLYVLCSYIGPEFSDKIQNPYSIFYPSTESPNWTWLDNDMHVYPAPTSTYPARYYEVVTPSPIEHDASSVAKFPDELESALVYGACVRLKHRQITYYNEEEDPEIVQLHQIQHDNLNALYAKALAPYTIPAEA